ncbi:MAG: 50S ribosomal protein L17 [Deltaproteobacteria bacterium CG07_land_8_20_14_0_80_38_7]|nr:MAG: 50S ribosomal protein L17 [Deltaproteobacteria bacterium CG07_land_8_20_14_0_80_38_7]
MKHRVAERKLGVKTAHRQAILANLASSLIIHDRIETTLTRAKELRRIADKIVTLTKRGSVHSARKAREILRNRTAVHKAFTEYKDRFKERHGGYTRILKMGHRHGDSAPMAIIEYVDAPIKEVKEPKEKKGAKKSASEKVKTIKVAPKKKETKKTK